MLVRNPFEVGTFSSRRRALPERKILFLVAIPFEVGQVSTGSVALDDGVHWGIVERVAIPFEVGQVSTKAKLSGIGV